MSRLFSIVPVAGAVAVEPGHGGRKLLMAIVERCFLANRSESLNKHMVWRQLADGIGLSRVAGDGKGLAPTSAEIDLAARTACAWLAHPPCAAESGESRRAFPDIGQRTIPH